MKIYNIAISNIKRDRIKYGMYFFSLTFCIFVAYTLLNLASNKTILMAYNNDIRYKSMLLSFTYIAIFFIFTFLISSNTRFIRARKKEISTFALFGMNNNKIGLMLLWENMIIGYSAMFLSIVLGIVFSKFIAMILINITLVDQIGGKLKFPILLMPIIKTVSIFSIIFILMSISSWVVIGRFQLVELFKADKVAEKKSRGSSILLIISLFVTCYGYWMACSKDDLYIYSHTVQIIVTVVLGTYLFFYSGLPTILSVLKSRKSNVYDGIKMITYSTLSHRIKTISITMASIAVLSAVATTAVASTFTLYYNAKENAYSMRGQDIYFTKNETIKEEIYKTIDKNGSEVIESMDLLSFITNVELNQKGKYFILEGERPYKIYSESMLRRLIKISRYNNLNIRRLNKGESYFLAGKHLFEESRLNFTNTKYKIGDLSFKFLDAFNSRALTLGAREVIVLSDVDFNSLLNKNIISNYDEDGIAYETLSIIKYKNPLSVPLSKEIDDLFGDEDNHSMVYSAYRDTLMTFGLVCFIGMFMGALFILMSASHLYFEQIMFANEEKSTYRILRKLGLGQKLEDKIIARRLLPVFFYPLSIGIIHSVFAMKSADTVIFNQVVNGNNTFIQVIKCSIVMYLLYIVVYMMFYFITKAQYSRIIKN